MTDNKFKNQLKVLGGNIRKQRNSRGLTQEQLAELADLNLRTVQKIEAGDINILITTAIRIQKGLKCSWEKLIPDSH